MFCGEDRIPVFLTKYSAVSSVCHEVQEYSKVQAFKDGVQCGVTADKIKAANMTGIITSRLDFNVWKFFAVAGTRPISDLSSFPTFSAHHSYHTIDAADSLTDSFLV